MKHKTKYATLNNYGKLEIHTDNAVITDEQTSTEINGCDTFEIDGNSLLKIYAMMRDKRVTIIDCENSAFRHTEVIVVGENSEAKELAAMCKLLLVSIENFNNTRHWWERKLKIGRELRKSTK